MSASIGDLAFDDGVIHLDGFQLFRIDLARIGRQNDDIASLAHLY